MDVSKITVNKQSSILIHCGKNIYLDPFDINDSPHDADYIFITHDHYDHFSMEDIKKIMNDKTVFIIPESMEKTLRNNVPNTDMISVVPGQKYDIADLSFETVPAYNKVKPFHAKRAGWCGYILTIEGQRIYIAGDTDATKEAEEVSCDIALIPIGGTFTMNYKEAAKLINKIKPQVAIPTHYGSIVGKESDGEDFRKLIEDGISVELKL